MVNKEKVLVIYKKRAGYIESDIQELSKDYSVKELKFGSKGGILVLVQSLKLSLRLLFMPKVRFILVWFGGYHSLITALFYSIRNIPTLLVIGGSDAANLPEFNYGMHRKPILSLVIRWSCRFASHVLPVSSFTQKHLERNIGPTPTTIVYNGIRALGKSGQHHGKKRLVATVCLGSDVYRFKLKGLDVFLECAKMCSSHPFVIIGPEGTLKQLIEARKSNNVIITPPMKWNDYISYLGKVKVICQFSRFESFGVSVLEAAQLGAFPVCAHDIGPAEMLPESHAIFVNIENPEAISEQINNLMKTATDQGDFYSTYVKDNLSVESRIQQIKNLVHGG